MKKNIFNISSLLLLFSTVKLSAQINITYTIDELSVQSTISPFIYGMNNGGYNQATIRRQGGNRMTGYNWENNASNAGIDWQNFSDDYLCSVSGINPPQSSEPAKYTRFFHEQALANNAQSAITIPMAGYVARDKNGTVAASEAAPSSRWNAIANQKESAFSMTPNTTDNVVYTDEYLNYLITTYGKSTTTTGIKNYIMDNEPSLWNYAHPRIVQAANNIGNFMTKTIALSKVIKTMDTNANIFGPESYGFSEYFNFQDANDWSSYSGTYHCFLGKYLADFKTASTTANKRLLDVLTVHWYPQDDGANIYSPVTDAATVEARVQNPRMLWDNTFIPNSWIYTWHSEFIPILPYLKNQINTYYPGTKLGVTEYDYGADSHYSGGIAQAEALMGFIKTKTEYAFKWNPFADYSLRAVELFNSVPLKFGSISINADSNNRTKSNIVATLTDASGKELHIIVTNKDATQSINATFNLNKITSVNYSKILVYNVLSSSPIINTQNLNPAIITSQGFSYTLAPGSIYHFVLTNDSTLSTQDSDISSSAYISPNPTKGDFNIYHSSDVNAYDILDSTGNIVLKNVLPVSQSVITVHFSPSQSAGLYLVKLYYKNGNNKILKMLKN